MCLRRGVPTVSFSLCLSSQLLHGKSRVLDALLRVASDPRLSEDALVDLLMDALADERFLPPAVNSYGGEEDA